MATDQLKHIFIPLQKVDAVNRLVYGKMAAEMPDDAEEVFDYATSKPLVQEWSDMIHKASNGKSFGNVRAMHGKVAAGLLQEIAFDDEGKSIECCAHIVDDNEWDKVEKGVYNGFSIGGSYVKRWNEGGLRKYTAKPVEVSIVDNPSCKGSFFQFVKMSGDIEDRPFVHLSNPGAEETELMVTNDMVVARAQELAKAAGSNTFADFIEPARVELEKGSKAKAEDDSKKTEDDEPKTKGMKLTADEKKAVAAHMKEKGGDKANEAYQAFKDGDMTSDHAKTIAASLNTSDNDDCKSAAGKFSDFKAEKASVADPRDELSQVWQAKDGTTFAKKSEALAHNLALSDPMARVEAAAAGAKQALEKAAGAGIEQLAKASGGKFTHKDFAHAPDKDDPKSWKLRLTKTPGGDPDKKLVNAAAKALAAGKIKMSAAENEKATKKVKSAWKECNPDKEEDDMPEGLKAEKFAGTKGLEKGLWDVQDFAQCVQTIAWLRQGAEYEAAVEGDNSPIAARLTVALDGLAQILIDWMGEEVRELIGQPVSFDDSGQPIPDPSGGGDSVMAKFATGNLAKVGARNSKEDMAMLQSMHDMATKLGATCGGTAEKHAHGGNGELLEKFSAMEAREQRTNDALDKALGLITSMSEELTKMASQPVVAPPTRLQVVDKAGDSNQKYMEGVHAQQQLEKMSPDVLATAAILLSQRTGHRLNTGTDHR